MNATNREPAEILLIDEDAPALASAADALEAAGHIVYQARDRAAALKILRRSLGLSSPKCYPKPRGDVVVFTGSSILAPFIRRQTKAANRRALGRVAQFGISAKIADQNDFVERHNAFSDLS